MKVRIKWFHVFLTVQTIGLLAKICGVPMTWYLTLLPTVVCSIAFLLAIAITLYMGRPLK